MDLAQAAHINMRRGIEGNQMRAKYWVAFFGLVSSLELKAFRPRLATLTEVKVWEDDADSVAEHPDEADDSVIQKKMTEAVATVFSDVKDEASCSACKAGIRVLRTLAKSELTRKHFISSIKILCSTAVHQPRSVCKGIAESTGNSIFDILKKIPLFKGTVPQMACYAFGNVCPMPKIQLEPLTLPKPGTRAKPASESRSVKRVLHLTDIHFDREYKVGAEADCDKPICCQADSNSDAADKAIKSPAREWGEYKCDASEKMLRSLLKTAASKYQYDMILFTGDIPAHDLWKEDEKRTQTTATRVFDMLQEYFPQTNIYPAIGNHEPVPLNQFPFQGNTPLYKFMASQWAKWIPKDQLSSVAKGGYYAINHSKQLRVLVLNTNIYYTYNYHAFLDHKNKDPQGMMQWMIDQLQDAEAKGMRVYLSGHVPPGSTDFYQHWSDAFHRIITRYKDTISAQFYGHLHYDEFQIFYGSDPKTSKSAISMAYLAPSMSTLNGINPSFRVYDTNGDQVINYRQYYADLRQQQRWKSDANWQLLYEAKSTYGTITPVPPLTPAFWHEASSKMATNQSMFNSFWDYRKASGVREPCDSECRDRAVCSMKSGRSSDNCAIIIPFS